MRLEDLGLREGINETIAVTFFEDGRPNTAPVGVVVKDGKAKVRLYPSHTRNNVEREGRIWINVVWDPIVFALSTFEDLGEEWFESIKPPILRNALAWCEFECVAVGDGNPAEFELRLRDGSVVRREVRAVNRGFNALLEALICATRIETDAGMRSRIRELSRIVEKCGDSRTKEAFEIVLRRIR